MGFEVFEKGGIVMYILAALSIYTIAVVGFKLYQFYKAGVFETRFVDPVLMAVRTGDFLRAREMLQRAKGPVARIMQVSLDCVTNREMLQTSRESEISRVGSTDVRYLESHMRGLEMVSNVGPLLGLLGTVIGIVTAFSKLEGAGARVDPSMLAGGIWEALLTTVGGLVVAIPAVAAYYIFDGLIERVRGMMKDVSIQIMMLEDAFQRDERDFDRRREQARQREQEERERLQMAVAEPVRTTAKQRESREAREAREAAEMQAKREMSQMPETREVEEVHPTKATEEAVRQRKAKEEARMREAADDMRSTPQSSSTLKLLNPRYSHY